jgi:hypothetical protein
MRGLGYAIVLVALGAGCHRREPATKAVERYFAAVEKKDCPALMALTAPTKAATSCAEILDSFGRRQARLVAVNGSEPDGRDARVTIVHARVAFDGHEASWLVRAEADGDGWKLRF